MKTMIELLYNSFYIEPKLSSENERIERNAQELKHNFSEEQKKLLLKIIDDYDLIAEKSLLKVLLGDLNLGVD